VLGDVLTLPALFIATYLIGIHIVTPTLGIALTVVSLVLLVLGLRAPLPMLRRIVIESMPVLLIAGCVSAGAGIALEKSFATFDKFPALLVLTPAHLSAGGALGGVLAGRLATKMLLGLSEPGGVPDREARRDVALLFLLALPIYVFNAVGAHAVADAMGWASPGWGQMIGASLLAGFGSMVLVVLLAYYSTVAAVRTGLDPDTYGIPLVSSFVDFVGAMTLIVSIAFLGIT
jgi:mgtE-like transporter